jgi:Fe-S cluster biogenesis protein NfuA
MASPSDTRRDIRQIIDEVLEPLIRADGGKLHVLRADASRVHLHLGGRFAGCPGNAVVTRRILEPAIRAAAPHAAVTVSAGVLIPGDDASPDSTVSTR